MALATIWFTGGALLALILSLFGAGVEVRLAVFVVISFILLFFARPLISRYLNGRTVETSVDSLVGRDARITVEVNNLKGTGAVVVNGQKWMARALWGEDILSEDTQVVIREVRGMKLIVSSLENKNGATIKDVLDEDKEHQ